jgi:hypothetical protein
MKKLTLGLEQLEVDTFVAGPAGISPGTCAGTTPTRNPSPGRMRPRRRR